MKQDDEYKTIDKAYRKDDMRRNLERFSRFNLSGLFPTLKDSSPHFFESFNEAHFAVMFEFEPTIISVKSQPFSIRYSVEGVDHSYTPDFSVIDCNNRVKIIEVKVSAALNEKTVRKHKLIKHAFKQHGFEFQVMTEKDLPSRIAISNMMMLKRNAIALGIPDEEALNYLLNILSVPVSLNKAVDICKCLKINTNMISYCVLHDYVKIEVSSYLTGETLLSSNIYGGE
ncbi:Tn7 transposase TnsA N-terminal domain-containing protein [Pseudoalteromonas sp. MMG010]|uniref:TnsA endonuclease N-terminal domain-containing protein n=1 Tax=Pseudoalteromonas sp. MMG010 TaxID=2822685 RepID=UPI001B3A0471|nr:Tn7 transposase TnsA N-terminal domain-containing protein [Pseudoalteromonas sp. MMG010]